MTKTKQPTSKIIQIKQFEHGTSYLTALCEDGSIWELVRFCIEDKHSEEWRCIFESIISPPKIKLSLEEKLNDINTNLLANDDLIGLISDYLEEAEND